jgi:pyridoxine 5-phosphate synthase
MRLHINIDHVATVRQARRTDEPDPVRAAVLAELGGADGITVHLREDRRHIQDRDVRLLLDTVRTGVNLELAATPAMVEIGAALAPMTVTLVPERREEITTEGGLLLSDEAGERRVAHAVGTLRAAGLRTALFIGPDSAAVAAAARIGADAIELHTGAYAECWKGVQRRPGHEPAEQLARLRRAAELARTLGLAVHAGHGLTYENVMPVAAIPEIEELNIGHSVMSRAILVGMERAVAALKRLVRQARAMRMA